MILCEWDQITKVTDLRVAGSLRADHPLAAGGEESVTKILKYGSRKCIHINSI